MRIPVDVVRDTLVRILSHRGFTPSRAQQVAQLVVSVELDGVRSHGLARFPRFLQTIDNGTVDPTAEPVQVAGRGALERWDGRRGPGNLNAQIMMERAQTLARTHGIGWVALANTNHWMRGGSYGWQAAEQGFIALCWTNTMPNLPPWGATQAAIGNNPLVLAVPRAAGPIVLDMAMSQFSFGALSGYEKRSEPLPVAGGFDLEGQLTTDPAAIRSSGRALPAGFWKGSGLAVLLDLLAAMTALGQATWQIPADPLRESGLSQVFVAVDPTALGPAEALDHIADGVVASVNSATPADPAHAVRYPGQQTLALRMRNQSLGIDVDPVLWSQLETLGTVPV